jgi:hypothetical protein
VAQELRPLIAAIDLFDGFHNESQGHDETAASAGAERAESVHVPERGSAGRRGPPVAHPVGDGSSGARGGSGVGSSANRTRAR